MTPACAGLLKHRGSRLGLLKSTYIAENFVCRFSWSISSHFVAIQWWNVRCIQKLWKNMKGDFFKHASTNGWLVHRLNLALVGPTLSGSNEELAVIAESGISREFMPRAVRHSPAVNTHTHTNVLQYIPHCIDEVWPAKLGYCWHNMRPSICTDLWPDKVKIGTSVTTALENVYANFAFLHLSVFKLGLRTRDRKTDERVA